MYNVTKSLPRLAPPPSPDEKVGGEPVNEANVHADCNLQSHIDTAHVELELYMTYMYYQCVCVYPDNTVQQLSLVVATRNTLAELVLHASGQYTCTLNTLERWRQS